VKTMLVNEITKDKIMSGEVSLSGVLQTEIANFNSKIPSEGTMLTDSAFHRKLQVILKPFYLRYDTNNDGHLDRTEITQTLKDLGESASDNDVNDFFQR